MYEMNYRQNRLESEVSALWRLLVACYLLCCCACHSRACLKLTCSYQDAAMWITRLQAMLYQCTSLTCDMQGTTVCVIEIPIVYLQNAS